MGLEEKPEIDESRNINKLLRVGATMDNNTFPEEITKQTGLSADEYQYIFDFETTRGAQDLEGPM